MAENKEGFILYKNILSSVEDLTDEEAGKLFKHVLRYVNDLNPVTHDRIVQVAFNPIKTALKDDLKKYKAKCKKNLENIGKRWNTKTYDGKRPNTKRTDIDIDIDNKNTLSYEFVDVAWKIPFMQWVEYRNAGKKPFTIQMAVEQSYKELKGLSEDKPYNANKIVQYCISNQYVTLCKPDNRKQETPIKIQYHL